MKPVMKVRDNRVISFHITTTFPLLSSTTQCTISVIICDHLFGHLHKNILFFSKLISYQYYCIFYQVLTVDKCSER